MYKILKVIDKTIEKLATWGLVFCVGLMLLITIFAILMRWMEQTFLWADPLVRHLVFLSAFLGGTVATGRRRHIGIDVISKFLESKNLLHIQIWIRRVLEFTSFLIMIWLCKASFDLMQLEFKFGKIVFLGVHSGVLIGIIPFGILLIAYRFFFLFIQSFVEPQSTVSPEGA